MSITMCVNALIQVHSKILRLAALNLRVQAKPKMTSASSSPAPPENATFALGCFWESEGQYGIRSGVLKTKVGYTGGKHENPTYRNLVDHTEAVQIDFDPTVISYNDLLALFWTIHDPTEKFKVQYQSAIYYHNAEQKSQAETTKVEAQRKYPRPIVTKILPAGHFYNAEDYHQKYYLRCSVPLFEILGLEGERLIDSVPAAKLNGYCGGYGSIGKFDTDALTLGLTEHQLAVARKITAVAKPLGCGT